MRAIPPSIARCFQSAHSSKIRTMDLQKLQADIIQAEGVRKEAYKDTLGLWTVGVGHLLPQSKDWTGATFEMPQVLAWLADDLQTAERLAHGLPEWPALDTDARQNAVVELVFNMGLSHWQQFKKARAAMVARDWMEAEDQLVSSVWAKQVGPHRAGRIANYITTGRFS